MFASFLLGLARQNRSIDFSLLSARSCLIRIVEDLVEVDLDAAPVFGLAM